MPHSTVVINVVGLSSSLLNGAAPNIEAFAARGQLRRLQPVLPAVTCSVQASMLTGASPAQHGIVGNGWYNHELGEVQFWKQANHLVQAEPVWETARKRDPAVTCANMFWWFNMYSSADASVTPRPIYKADGRKVPDVYSEPPDLRPMLQETLGRFPLFKFWGPGASVESTRWIADAARVVHERVDPTLMLVYLPHLDYSLQRLGPAHGQIAAEVSAIDAIVGDMIEHYEQRGARVLIVSEYGIEPVSAGITVNRHLREHGKIRVREEEGLELLDAGASDAFAVADHQIAHVYVKHAADVPGIADICRTCNGVERALDRSQQRDLEIDHARAGDLVLIAKRGRWFSYHYWLDDARAPDFARTVDIHRKPGYDPLELFLDPAIIAPKARIAAKLLRRKLGFRALMNVIPLDNSLVRGSHGRVEQEQALQPVLIASRAIADEREPLPCQAVRGVILEHLFG